MTRAVLMAAVAAAVAGGVRADDAAVAVVKKGVEAMGGEAALKKYPGGEYKLEGERTVGGEKGKYTSTISYAMPDMFRTSLEYTSGTTKMSQLVVVNGSKVKATINGKAVEVKAELKAELLQLAAVQEMSLLYPLLDDKKYTLTSEKDESIDGTDAAVVLVTRKDVRDVRLYFDKKTGHLVRFTRKIPDPLGQEVLTEVTQGDFKKYDGVFFPTTQTVKQAGKEFMTLKLLDMKLIEKSDPKAFSAD